VDFGLLFQKTVVFGANVEDSHPKVELSDTMVEPASLIVVVAKVKDVPMNPKVVESDAMDEPANSPVMASNATVEPAHLTPEL